MVVLDKEHTKQIVKGRRNKELMTEIVKQKNSLDIMKKRPKDWKIHLK